MDSNDEKSVNFCDKYYKYLSREVVVKTCKSSHTGSLKCIDPLTQTIALIVTDLGDKTSKVVIAMSHSIRSIELVDKNEDNVLSSHRNIDWNSMTDSLSDKTYSCEELLERKQNVMNWMQKNRIPCQESEDSSLWIAFALTLSPPYSVFDCICGNELVLQRIQTLLQSMPQNGAKADD